MVSPLIRWIGVRRGQALRPGAGWQARLKKPASSTAGHARMVNGWTAASGEENFEFSAGIARFGDILK